LRLEVVRTLARDLAGELQALSVLADAETGAVEGALRAADLANLAACVVPELTEARAAEAAAASWRRPGAAWRARLAVRQMNEFFEGEG
jgi:hypothetical protein